jgi:large subunit ribosomal protein L17
MVAALLTYERISTTVVKAKEIRRLAERAITWARRLGPVLTKKPDKRSDEERARVVHAMRMALRVVRDRDAVLKLFDEIGPRFLARHGGYTRLMKTDQRPGDAAPMALLELIPAEGAEVAPKTPEKTGKEGKAAKETKEGGESKGKAKAGAPAKAQAPKPKAKGPAAPKGKPGAGPARAPAKSAATMKRSSRSRGGE